MIALALLCAAQLGLIAWLLRHAASQEREWAAERRLLISRIQHPEVVQTPTEALAGLIDESLTQEIRRPEPDEIDLVGTIQSHRGDGD